MKVPAIIVSLLMIMMVCGADREKCHLSQNNFTICLSNKQQDLENPAEIEKLTEYMEHISTVARTAIQSCSPNNDVSEKGLALYDECYDKSIKSVMSFELRISDCFESSMETIGICSE